jgi:hypothetical protein
LPFQIRDLLLGICDLLLGIRDLLLGIRDSLVAFRDLFLVFGYLTAELLVLLQQPLILSVESFQAGLA